MICMITRATHFLLLSSGLYMIDYGNYSWPIHIIKKVQNWIFIFNNIAYFSFLHQENLHKGSPRSYSSSSSSGQSRKENKITCKL